MFESRCGVCCSSCERKTQVNCKGCIYMDKPFWGGDCGVKSCCEEKGFNHCGECDIFPCEMVATMGVEMGYDPAPRLAMCQKWMDEMNEIIEQQVDNLCCKDNNIAYEALKFLDIESQKSDSVYRYCDRFIQMLDDKKSYIRTRGMLLISANAKWDKENKIDEIIDEYLKHITDEKPITARQCIKALSNIAKYKPDLSDAICLALTSADITIYNENMKPLIHNDIIETLKEIKG